MVTSRKLNTHKNVRFDPFVVHRYIRCRRALSTIHSLAFCFEGRFVMLDFFCLVPFPGETRFPSFVFGTDYRFTVLNGVCACFS